MSWMVYGALPRTVVALAAWDLLEACGPCRTIVPLLQTAQLDERKTEKMPTNLALTGALRCRQLRAGAVITSKALLAKRLGALCSDKSMQLSRRRTVGRSPDPGTFHCCTLDIQEPMQCQSMRRFPRGSCAIVRIEEQLTTTSAPAADVATDRVGAGVA